jgi:hypothetical protein
MAIDNHMKGTITLHMWSFLFLTFTFKKETFIPLHFREKGKVLQFIVM